MDVTGERQDRDVVVYAVLFLFLLQLLTDFIEAVYAFGLLGTGIPPEIASVVLLLAPVALLLWRGEVKRGPLVLLAALILVARVAAPLLGTRGRMWVSGVGTAAGLMWLPALLSWSGRRTDADAAGRRLGLGLLVAVLLSVVFRAAGSGLDLSARGPTQVAGWGLAVLAAVLLLRASQESETRRDSDGDGAAGESAAASGGGFGRLVALAMGTTSALLLLYFAFMAPAVVARWAEVGYPGVVVTLVVGMGLFVAVGVLRPFEASRGLMALLNGLFVLALAAALRAQQIAFPAELGAYPLYATEVSWVQLVPLYAALLFFPAIVLDFSLYARETVAARPSLRALGGAFGVSALYLVVMVFAHVFTTVYDYIPVVGPAFRDRFWLVYFGAGLGLALPLAALRRRPFTWRIAPRWAGALGLLGVLAVIAVGVTLARPPQAAPKPTLTVLTYNIQQGYGAEGERAAERQLALMREADADVIGLQESDTARITGGNVDLVRYFADGLDMYSYYGPPTTVGTFGIALLSRYPIEDARTFYMYSEGEQTATLSARIAVGETAYHVFVTHLGNGGPLVQQQAVLQIVAEKEDAPVVLMGDFNFRPDTDQYALTTSALDDAWLRRWPDGVDDAGVRPEKRIDHVFVSPGLAVEDVRYIDDPASDHPAVRAVVGQATTDDGRRTIDDRRWTMWERWVALRPDVSQASGVGRAWAKSTPRAVRAALPRTVRSVVKRNWSRRPMWGGMTRRRTACPSSSPRGQSASAASSASAAAVQSRGGAARRSCQSGSLARASSAITGDASGGSAFGRSRRQRRTMPRRAVSTTSGGGGV
ncbi:MAG: endonuclease/exonuclease/phosphatase family protein [Anaerolineae bacterium]